MVHSVYPTWPWKIMQKVTIYVSHWVAQKIRAARYISEVLQSPSAWLLWMSLSALCPAGICQSHDQLQAKGNCICQELLWEFSLTDIFCCCSLVFLFPSGFLYFTLTALWKQEGWQCMFIYCRLILPTLCFFSDFISLFQMHLKLYLKENTNLFKSYEYSILISHASMVWMLLLPYLFQNHIMQTIYLVQSHGTQAII